jgi:acyl carrier protein
MKQLIFFQTERIAEMTEIEDRVIAFISKQLEVENVNPEMHFLDDLGMDSISLIELIVDIEQNFGVVIPDEQINRIKAVRDILVNIEGHGSK